MSTATAIEDDRIIYAKLEAVKEIRTKTIQLEKLKSRLLYEIDSQEHEDKSLAEFRQEMDLLLQEKMSHVEELRQIHADINAMEGVIKHSEETRQKSINAALRLHEEYVPLKIDIDRLRRECLGLERLPEFHEEDSGITPEKLSKLYSNAKAQTPFYKSMDWTRSMTQSNSTLTSLVQPPPPPSIPSTFLPPPNPLRLTTSKSEAPGRSSISSSASSVSSASVTTLGPSLHTGPPTPTFRQQPPPMKSCLSCHQQIHRNAPICPLCKAKSRSRNPKKPKKKDH